jgi:lipoate-protein ligase A
VVNTINANAPEPITMEDFKILLKRYIFQSGELVPINLTDAQMADVKLLRDEKYASWEWNYGFSPAYEIKKEMKFPAGMVEVFLTIEQNRVRTVRFFGDFFGNGELCELERAIVGLPMGPGLLKVLEKIDIESYMNGITSTDIYRLLDY